MSIIRVYCIFTLLLIGLFCLKKCCGSYIPMWSCDFDNGMCHWLQMKNDDVDWTLQDGSVHDRYDHTKFLGKYLMINNANEGEKAILMSPTLRPSNGSCKMIFFHLKEDRSSSSNLEVFIVMKLGRTSLFRSSIEYTSWKKEELILNSSSEFQIEIVATAGDRHYRDIAIDDILFTDACMTTEKSSIHLMKLSKSPKHNFPEGFLFEKTNSTLSRICTQEKAKLACMQLGLADVLVESPSLNGYYSGQTICQPSNITSPAALGCSGNSTGCQTGVYWKCKQNYLPICPKLTHTSCTSSGISTKCISFSQICDYVKDCPGGEDESNCLRSKRCNFETDTCDWRASKNTFFEWERYKGLTDAIPMSQYYMRVDTSHAPDTTSVANLKMLHAVQGQKNVSCALRFFYHVTGSWGGNISLIVKENDKDRSIWTRRRTGGRRYDIKWHRGVVQLPKNSLYNLFFRASYVGGQRIGEFGLNNVSFSESCKFENYTIGHVNMTSSLFHCQSGEVIQQILVCDFKADCYDGSDEVNCGNYVGRCNFDASLCGWTLGQDSMGVMKRWRGNTLSSYTGPQKDHTNKLTSGYYMYLEATDLKNGQYAYLLSNLLSKPKTGKCTFRWFYHMYDGYETFGMGKLQIILYSPIKRSNKVLWTKQYNQGNSWHYGSVTFDVDSLKFQIKIRAERGSSYRSDVAIDDVSFSSDCYEISTLAAPVVTQSCNITGGTFFSVVDQGGTILSPHFSNRIPEPLACNWTVTVQPGHRIYLKSNYFISGTSKAYMKINGSVNGSMMVGGIITGNRTPFYLISSGNIVQLEFVTEKWSRSLQFLCIFNTTDIPAQSLSDVYNTTSPGTQKFTSVRRACGSVISHQNYASGSGTLSSPIYRGGYWNNIDCIYRFFGTPGYRVYVSFTLFQTEKAHDFIEVHGILGQSKFSGSLAPFYFITTSNSFSIRFKTDGSVTKRGFSFDFALTMQPPSPFTPRSPASTASPITSRSSTSTATSLISSLPYTRTSPFYTHFTRYCSGAVNNLRQLSGSNTYGTILSPNYPSHYPNSIKCHWYSRNLQNGKRYILEFASFVTENHHDYLVIKDGNSYSSLQLQRLSGYWSYLPLIRTSKNSFSLLFTSDGVGNENGFNLKYSTYPGCYDSSLTKYYTYAPTGNGDVEKCLKACHTLKFQFAAFSVRSCYCGGHTPSQYSYYMTDPSNCFSCLSGKYQCGSSSSASLYFASDGKELLSKADAQKNSGTTNGAVIGTLTTVALLSLLLVGFCYYKKKKGRSATTPRDRGGLLNRSRGVAGAANATGIAHQDTPHVLVPNVAYFVAPSHEMNHSTFDAPPAYSDVVEGRVFFFDQLYGPTSSMTPINILEAPPSFSDALANQATETPPKYETLPNQIANEAFLARPLQVLAAEANAPPGRNSSPIPPKPDDRMRVSLHSLQEGEAFPNRPSSNSQQRPRSRANNNRSQSASSQLATGNGQTRNVRNLPPIHRVSPQDNAAFNNDELLL